MKTNEKNINTYRLIIPLWITIAETIRQLITLLGICENQRTDEKMSGGQKTTT